MQEDLVSIVTPCYNGSKYIDTFFTKMLEYTYPSIQIIIVNDGSNDDSEEKILSYKDRIEKKGYIFDYIKQSKKKIKELHL